MSYTTQLDWARRESHIWSWHHQWGRSNGMSYSRQLKSCKVTSRELCKQETPTLAVWGCRWCVPKGFTNEGRKEVWVKGKLSPRYIGPFPILEKCGTVVYKLELPLSLAGVHDIFHVSQLKKCLKAPMDVLLLEVTLLGADLTYPSIWSRSWITRVVSWGERRPSSLRSSGATIPQKKQHGKARISSVLAIRIWNYRSEGTCSCSLSL
jgi:hypothetical protein